MAVPIKLLRERTKILCECTKILLSPGLCSVGHFFDAS